MERLSIYISKAALHLLALAAIFSAVPAGADSMIRIIGDKAPTTLNNTSVPSAAETPVSSVKPGSTIRIIGDKRVTAPAPVSEQPVRQEQSPIPPAAKEIRIIGDRIETVQKKAPEQPSAAEAAEKEHKAKLAAEEENQAKELAEHAKRLTALKEEKERKAAEKAEQERLEKVKAEQENEAALQAAIRQEQEQLAARMAVEARKAALKAEQEKAEQEKAAADAALQAAKNAEKVLRAKEIAEQEHAAALKADEERLAAVRRALVEKLRSETDASPQQPVADFQAESRGFDVNADKDIKTENKSEQAPETIMDLYLSAKSSDPTLGRTEARVTGSKADSDVLLSGLLPHLDSNAGVKQISQTLTNYSANDASYDYTALNYNVTARMTLLHVPTLYSLSAAAAGLRVEKAGVVAARQNLIVKLIDAYFSLLKAQTEKQIAVGEINRLKQVLDQSQAFLKAGTGDVIAVYEAQSRLDGARADLTKSESSLRLAEQKLSTVVGKPVTSIVNYLPQQPLGPDPDNLDWWVATMETEQPVLRQAREGLAQIAEQRKAVKSEYLPVLQASGGYDVNRGTAALPTAEVRQWFVGASISLPLYSGGETAAKVRRAVASEEERRHMFDETMDQQRENVKQAFFNLRYNISFIKALEQKKASAEIQLAAVSKGRAIGTRNAIDLLNAEQAYSLALRDYQYALYDNVIRVIQLKSAAGILSEADVSEVSRAVAPVLTSRLR